MGNWGFVLWLFGLSIITFFAVAWLLDINNRYRQLEEQLGQTFTDAEGYDLSRPVRELAQRLDANEAQTQQLRGEFHQLLDQLPGGIQAVGLVRFQAFSDYGGDQSFALALASAEGDGVVISGIYAREGTRTYAKPLKKWSSSYSLSFEEEEAIAQARDKLQ